MATPYDPRIYWLLVTVSTIGFGFVACKPAEENASIATPEDTLNYGNPSTNKTDHDGPLENFLGNTTNENEEEFANTSVNEGTNRRPISTNPEHEHIGNDIESNDGMFFDTADWVKEAEQWTFKGGDWGLITLPDDNHPDIPNPPVPGPVLLAEGNSMGKVIVSRSEINVKNLTLHFSYFLSNNPASPPVLEVYQIKDNTHSERVAVETTYGQWTTSTLQLPYEGNFEIKFIGQRIVDANEIALDDIVLRGYYMKNMGTKDKQDNEEQHQQEDGKENLETSDDNDKQDDKEQHQEGDDEENHETSDDEDNSDNDWFGIDDWFGNYSITSDDGKPTENPVIIFNSEGAGEVNEFSEIIDDPGTNGGIIFFVVVSVTGICLLGLLYWKKRRGHQWEDDEVSIYNRKDHDDYEGVPYDQPNEDDSLTAKLQNYKSFD